MFMERYVDKDSLNQKKRLEKYFRMLITNYKLFYKMQKKTKSMTN